MDEYDPDGESPHVPARTVLISVGVLWAFYYVMTSLRGVMLGMEHQTEMLLPRLLVSMAGAIITLAVWLLMRPFDLRPLGTRIAVSLVAALPAAVLIAQVNEIAFAELNARMADHYKADDPAGVRILRDETGNLFVDIPGMPRVPVPEPDVSASHTQDKVVVKVVRPDKQHASGWANWKEITDVAMARYFLLVAWAALYQAMLGGTRARVAERREGEHRRAAKAAELRSLRYQVNPHFLFNTLNSLSALVVTGRADKAERMIQTISTFYRSSLAEDPTGDVTLAEEFEHQRLYMEIESVRFPLRLKVEFDLPAELEKVSVPGMILQPLVENSVKYAVAPTSRTVHVRIAAHRDNGALVLSVCDDGTVEPGQPKPAPGHGIGLTNVHQRLKARFGEDAHVVSGRTGKGYETIITIPLPPPAGQ